MVVSVNRVVTLAIIHYVLEGGVLNLLHVHTYYSICSTCVHTHSTQTLLHDAGTFREKGGVWSSGVATQQATAVTSLADRFATFATFADELKETFSRIDPIPDEDWPPSIGRHESNLVMIEHG